MGLRFTILASGSTGNATIVQTDDVTLLIDAGLSARKLEERMRERGIHAADIDAVFVTHEHADHVNGLGAFARKYELPVYANEATWAAMERQTAGIPDANRRTIATGGEIEFGGLVVRSYPVSHDAAEPVGYCFLEGDCKLSLVTDLGYFSDKVKEAVIDSDVVVLEANHDVEMLRMGRYPWNVKRRILSDVGHLSNDAAGEALAELMTDRTKRVYLAHLSLDHNMQDLARMTVESILESRGIFLKKEDDVLKPTWHDRATPWDDVTRRVLG